jgi:hypothetical protein
MHFTPVHCSWMNQVEQSFSILRRKRLKAPNFADLTDLEVKILAFIDEWNKIAHPFNWTPIAHPFNWTPKSFERFSTASTILGAAARTGATLSRRQHCKPPRDDHQVTGSCA